MAGKNIGRRIDAVPTRRGMVDRGGYEGTRRIICMTCEYFDGSYCGEPNSGGPRMETEQCGFWKESYGFYANCIDTAAEEAQDDFRRTYITPEEAKLFVGGGGF